MSSRGRIAKRVLGRGWFDALDQAADGAARSTARRGGRKMGDSELPMASAKVKCFQAAGLTNIGIR